MQEHAQILSAKYQKAKTENEQILWRYLLENCADFHSLSEAGGCRAVRSETEACVDDIRLCTELVGEGHFGQVRLGVTPMGATVAVKRISKAKVRSLHGENVPIVETTEERLMVPLLREALGLPPS